MADWIAETFNRLGYLGIALAMLLENVFPPIPSEAVLPAAGMTARRGGLSLIGVILAASAGSLVGAILWYFVGRWIGSERLRRWSEGTGRYFGFRAKDIDRSNEWFGRWGGMAVFVGRMIPGIRTLVSVPAGVAGMPFAKFLVYSAAGTALWSTLLVMIGWWIGQSSKLVEQVISWVGIAVIVGIVGWLAYRAWKAAQHRQSKSRRSRVEAEDTTEFSQQTPAAR